MSWLFDERDSGHGDGGRGAERTPARLDALLEHCKEFIAVVDTEHRLLYASPASHSLLGISPEEALGRPFPRYAHPEDRRSLERLLEHVAGKEGTVLTFDIRLGAAEGRSRLVELTASNHIDDPAVGGIVLNGHDVGLHEPDILQLDHIANHDALTGLANRRLFIDRLEDALVAKPGDSERCAVLFVDVDDFKAVNDTYGRLAGDEVLRAVAARLTAATRVVDSVARFGGDEFVVLARGMPGDDPAAELAERLLEALSQPVSASGRDIRVTASIGVAVSDGTDSQTLLSRADEALYQAKHNGKNQFVAWASTGLGAQ